MNATNDDERYPSIGTKANVFGRVHGPRKINSFSNMTNRLARVPRLSRTSKGENIGGGANCQKTLKC